MCGKSAFSVSFVLLLSLVLISAVYAAEPNLVSWWKFDEGSGTRAYDLAGGNHGTLLGGPSWVALSIKSYVLSFDGDNDYVNCGDDSTLNFDTSDSFTISAWIKTPGEHDGSTGDYIIGKRGEYLPYTYALGVSQGSDVVQFWIYDGTNAPHADTTTVFNDNKWHHIVGVRNVGADSLSIYVDGVLEHSVTDTVTGSIASVNSMSIGCALRSAGPIANTYFNGTIDDVRIYNRALPIEEVQQLYRDRYGSRASGPSPHDKAIGAAPNVVLSWLPGDYTVSHDVYFDTDYNDVNDAVNSFLAGDVNSDSQVDWYDVLVLNEQWLGELCGLGPSADLDGDGDVNLTDFAIMANDWKKCSVYKGNQEPNSYAPGSLKIGRSYYWRIDEVNDANVWRGEIWDFTVIPRIAYNPSPADEVNELVRPDNTLTLSWSPGIDANSHNVYMGTDYNDVNDANTVVYKGNQEANSYGPFSPELGTTYYWRIDEVNGADIWKGEVWSFIAVPGVQLGVMSFNIKNDEGIPSSDPDAWICTSGTDRKDRVIDMILSESVAFSPNGPDIVGVQEALDNQVDDLQSALSDYDFYGVGRNDGVTDGEYAGIFYRSSRFSRTDQGTFWLSKTPDVPGSKYPGSNINVRIASWAILYDNMTEQSYFVLNTHWENDSQAARLWSAELIRERINLLSGGLPLIVMGDLNCYEDSEEFLELIGEHDPIGFQLLDSYREVYPVRQSNEATYHGWGGGTSGSRIDFIVHSEYFEAIGATIERAQIYGRYPSDHYPVTGTLYMAAAGSSE